MIKNYFTSGTFINFLWKPKEFFQKLRMHAIVFYPLLILISLKVVQMILLLTNMDILHDESLLGAIQFSLFSVFFTPVILITFSVVYFYLFYKFTKNKQTFRLILSITLHAYLASVYLEIFFQILNITIGIPGGLGVTQLFLNLIFILFFVYLAFGLKWAIKGSIRQFIVGYVSFLVIVFLLIIGLILLTALALISLFELLIELLNIFS